MIVYQAINYITGTVNPAESALRFNWWIERPSYYFNSFPPDFIYTRVSSKRAALSFISEELFLPTRLIRD